MRRLAQEAAVSRPESTLETLSSTIATQTQLLESQLEQLTELRQQLTKQGALMDEQGQRMIRLERGSHWSRQLFWCVVGVVLGALAGVLATAWLT